MNNPHQGARLTVYSREQIVARLKAAQKASEAAAAFWCFPAHRAEREHGIRAERVLTDKGSAYRSRRFAKAPRRLGIRHIFTRPYTPRTNGKAKKFIQTRPPEWAYGLSTSLSSRACNRIAHPLSRADPPRDRRARGDALETNYQMKEDEVRVFTRPPNAALYGRGDLLSANGSATSSSTARL